jgi:predicted Zn-dependent protease
MALEQKTTIPAEYNKQLTKLWLIEHWPEQRKEIVRHIDQGEGRKRPHGDVEDIGFREIVKNPTEDIEVGKQAVRQMTSGGWLPSELQDERTQNYVRKVADRIAVNSDLKVPLHVTVVDSGDLKVTALPGGFLYVTSGLVMATHNESEFAGILSREIARIAARHAARASKHSLVSKMFLPIAQIATGFFSPGLNQAAYYGIGYGMQGLSGVMDHMMDGAVEKYQKEADQLGVQYAWKAGFDPRGGIEFLDSLEGNAATEFLSPNPVLKERLLNIFSEVEYLGPLSNAALDSPEFHATRERLQSEVGGR